MKLLRFFDYPSSMGKVTSWEEYQSAPPELIALLEECRELVKNTKFERFPHRLLPKDNFSDGREVANKQVYEIEKDGVVFCLQFHDWHIGTGSEPYNHDGSTFLPLPEAEWREKRAAAMSGSTNQTI
jgi:hypothetical protein